MRNASSHFSENRETRVALRATAVFVKEMLS